MFVNLIMAHPSRAKHRFHIAHGNVSLFNPQLPQDLPKDLDLSHVHRLHLELLCICLASDLLVERNFKKKLKNARRNKKFHFFRPFGHFSDVLNIYLQGFGSNFLGAEPFFQQRFGLHGDPTQCLQLLGPLGRLREEWFFFGGL